MLTLSFDDGTVQDRRFIELIDKYDLRCTFNLNSGLFGNKHEIIHEGIRVCHNEVDESEVRSLYRNHEVAAHTLTHPNLCRISEEEVIRETENDVKKLSALTGKEIFGLAYPGGSYDARTADILRTKTSVKYARTINSHGTFALPEDFLLWHPTCHQNDPRLEELAKQFTEITEPQADLLFYVWGHSFEFDKFESWERFEDFCRIISHHSDICYMTNGEVYNYITKKQNSKNTDQSEK